MITIDLDKAKNIYRDTLRLERIPLLQILDILYLKALETNNNDEQKKVAQKKQLLRDLPNNPLIVLAQSVQELQSLNLLAEINIYE